MQAWCIISLSYPSSFPGQECTKGQQSALDDIDDPAVVVGVLGVTHTDKQVNLFVVTDLVDL